MSFRVFGIQVTNCENRSENLDDCGCNWLVSPVPIVINAGCGTTLYGATDTALVFSGDLTGDGARLICWDVKRRVDVSNGVKF